MEIRRSKIVVQTLVDSMSKILVICLIWSSASFAEVGLPPSPIWPDGIYEWFYNGENHPSWLTEEDAKQLVVDATMEWQACGVSLNFLGDTRLSPGAMDGVNVVGWSFSISPTLRGITLGRSNGRLLIEKDVLIRPDRNEFKQSQRLLKKVIIHEIGHAIGLKHSNQCVDVMTLASDCPRTPSYLLPLHVTDADLNQCKDLYKLLL